MHRFEVHANGKLIGHSELEAGDPPMGVAGGRLLPSSAYGEFQSRFAAAAGCSVSGVELSVHLPGRGRISCSGGVSITDYSADLGPEGIQVSALGIPYPLYEELFPSHVAAYQAQFR